MQQAQEIMGVIEELNSLTDERLLLYTLALAIVGFVLFLWVQRGRRQVDMTMLKLIQDQQAFAMHMQTARETEAKRSDAALTKLSEAVAGLGELIDKREAALTSEVRSVDSHLTRYEQTGSKPLQALIQTVDQMFTHVREIHSQVGNMGDDLDAVIANLRTVDASLQTLHQAIRVVEAEAKEVKKTQTGEMPTLQDGGREQP